MKVWLHFPPAGLCQRNFCLTLLPKHRFDSYNLLRYNRFMTKADLNAALSELKAELVKWMFGGFMAIIGLLITLLVKLH